MVQQAEDEAIILSLDPKAGKKKKPTKLKPLEPTTDFKGKISGNFAAEVLAQMEERDKNKERAQKMRQLDKEINNFLSFNQSELTKQMNDAFEGKKNDWRDQYYEKSIKATHELQASKAETLV